MSQHVDERIVQMRFDNAQFEKGVSQTTQSLENLKKSLNFEDSANTAAKEIDKLSKTDMSKLSKNMDVIAKRMSGFGIMTAQVWERLGNNIINFGERVYNNTIGQIKSGGRARAENIANAKFQLKGLGVAWETVSDDIDYAVSGTAYGLDAAAKACGQLSASGVQAGEDMKKALRGISGVAAMANTSYEDISPIFTTIAGQGKVMTMQLRQLEARGINAAATLATAFGTTEENLRNMVTKGEVSFERFASAMDDAFGEHAKDANATYAGSLSNVRAALSRLGAKFESPMMEQMIPIFNNLRTIINNVSARLDPLIEKFNMIFAKGARLFSSFLGDIGESKDGLDGFIQVLGWLLDRIGNVLDFLYMFASTVKIVVGYILSAGSPTEALSRAFELLGVGANLLANGIGRLLGSGIQKVTSLFGNFGDVINGIFSGKPWYQIGLDAINGIVQGVSSGLATLFNLGKNVAGSLLSGLSEGGGWHSPWVETIKAGIDFVIGLFKGISSKLPMLLNFGKSIASSLIESIKKIDFGEIGKFFSEKFKRIFGGNEVEDAVEETVEKPAAQVKQTLKKKVSEVEEETDTLTVIGNALKEFWDKICEVFQDVNMSSVAATGGIVLLILIIRKLMKSISGVFKMIYTLANAAAMLTKSLAGLLASASKFMNMLTKQLGGVLKATKRLINAQALGIILTSLGKTLLMFTAAVAAFAYMMNNPDLDVEKAVETIMYVVGGMVIASALLMSAARLMGNSWGLVQLGATLLAIAFAISILSNVILSLKGIEFSESALDLVFGIITGLAFLLSVLAALDIWVSKTGGGNFKVSIMTAVAIIIALKVLINEMIVMAELAKEMRWQDVVKTLALFLSAIFGVALIIAATSFIHAGSGIGTFFTMLGIVGALWLIAKAISTFGSIDPAVMDQALINIYKMAPIFYALIAVAFLLNGFSVGPIKIGGNGLSGGIGALLLTLCLWLFPSIIMALAAIPPGDVDKAMTILGSLTGIVALLSMCALALGHAVKDFGKAVMAIGVGVAMLAFAMFEVSGLDWGQIAKSFVAVAGLLLTFCFSLSLIKKKIKGSALTILAIGAVILILAAAMAVLSVISWDRLIPAAIAMGVLIASIGFAFSQMAKIKDAKPAIVMAVAIAGLLIALYALATSEETNPEKLLAAAASISMILLALGGAAKLAKANKSKFKDLMKTLAMLLGLSVIAFGLIMGISHLTAAGSEGRMLAGAASISILLLAMAGFSKLFKTIDFGDSSWENLKNNLIFLSLIIAAAAGVIGVLGNFGGSETKMLAGAIAIGILINAMGTFSKLFKETSFTGADNKKQWMSMLQNFSLLGLVIAAAGAVLAIISSIPFVNPGTMLTASIAIGILINAMGTFTKLFEQNDFGNGVDGWNNMAMNLALMAGVVAVAGLVLGIIASLPSIDPGVMLTASISIGILINLMATMALILSKITPIPQDQVGNLWAMVGVISVLTVVASACIGLLTYLVGSNYAAAIPAATALGILIGAIGGVLVLVSNFGNMDLKSIGSFAIGAIALSAAVAIMAPGLSELAKYDFGALISVVGSISILLAALLALSYLAGMGGSQIFQGAAAIAVIGFAIQILAPTLVLLNIIDFDRTMGGMWALFWLLLAMGAVATGFGFLASMAGIIFAGAGAIAAIGGAVLTFLPTLLILNFIDFDRTMGGVGALSSLLLSLAGIGALFGVLGMLIGVIFIGANAISEIGRALLLFLPIITLLDQIGPRLPFVQASLESFMDVIREITLAFSGGFLDNSIFTGAAGIALIGTSLLIIIPPMRMISEMSGLKEGGIAFYTSMALLHKTLTDFDWNVEGTVANLITLFSFLVNVFIPASMIFKALDVTTIANSFMLLSTSILTLGAAMPSLAGAGDILRDFADGLRSLPSQLDSIGNEIQFKIREVFLKSGLMAPLALGEGAQASKLVARKAGALIGTEFHEGYADEVEEHSPPWKFYRSGEMAVDATYNGTKDNLKKAADAGKLLAYTYYDGVRKEFQIKKEDKAYWESMGYTVVDPLEKATEDAAGNMNFDGIIGQMKDGLCGSIENSGIADDVMSTLDGVVPDDMLHQFKDAYTTIFHHTDLVEVGEGEAELVAKAQFRTAQRFGYNDKEDTLMGYTPESWLTRKYVTPYNKVEHDKKLLKRITQQQAKVQKRIDDEITKLNLSSGFNTPVTTSPLITKLEKENHRLMEQANAINERQTGKAKKLGWKAGANNGTALNYTSAYYAAQGEKVEEVFNEEYTKLVEELNSQEDSVSNALEEALGGSGGGGGGGSSKADESLEKLKELNEAIDGMGGDLLDMSDAFYDKYGAMLIAIGDTAPYDTASKMLMAFGETLVDVGDLSEATEEEILEKSKMIMEALVDKYQGYKDIISAMFKDGNFFKEFEAKTELQADEVIKNMQNRLSATKTWAANLATLQAKGISNELYEELIQMGVEGGYETVNAFMQMSADELKNVDAMMTEAKNLEDSLAAQLLVGAADSAMKFTEGISNGIITNQSIALTAAGQMGANMITQMKVETILASTEQTPDMIAEITEMVKNGMLDKENLKILLDTIDQMIKESTDHATGDSKNKKNVEGVGEFMDEGIATGISSNAKEMPLEAMRKLVQELIAAAEDAAQVSSPSKWGIWFGHMIDYGIANGITEAQMAPIGASQNMINRLKNDLSGISAVVSSELTPTITPYLDLSMLEQGASAINGFFGRGVGLGASFGNYMSAQQAQMAAMAANSRGDSYNITINSPTTDARTLAREVEKAIVRR